jgi:Family of unknown function (DUF5681)
MRGKSGETYEVGYGKAPKGTRFQKGKSGNPSGRPKKVTQLLDPGSVIEAIDNEEILVTENGKRKWMKKAEIEFRQSFAKAIKGNLKTTRLLVSMAEDYFAPDAGANWQTELIGVTEAKRRFGKNWPKKVEELNAPYRSGL